MLCARGQKKRSGACAGLRVCRVLAILSYFCSGVVMAGFGLAINLSQPQGAQGRWSLVADDSVRAAVTHPPEQTTSVILCEGRIASVYHLQQAAVWPFRLEYVPLEICGSSRAAEKRNFSLPLHVHCNTEASSGGYTVRMTAELEEVVTALDPVRTLTPEHGAGAAFYLMLIAPPEDLISRFAQRTEEENVCQPSSSGNQAVQGDALHPCHTLRLTEPMHGDNTGLPWRCSLVALLGWPVYLDAATGRSTQRFGAAAAKVGQGPEPRSDSSEPVQQCQVSPRKVVSVYVESGLHSILAGSYAQSLLGLATMDRMAQEPGGCLMIGWGVVRDMHDKLCRLKTRTAGHPWRWPVDDVLMTVGPTEPGTQGYFLAAAADGKHLRIASYDGVERVLTPYKYIDLCCVQERKGGRPCGQCKKCQGGVCQAAYRIPESTGIPCLLPASLGDAKRKVTRFVTEDRLAEAVGTLTIEDTPGRAPQLGGQRDERLWGTEALAPDECVVVVACYQPCRQRYGSDSLTGTRWLRLRLTAQGLRPVHEHGEHTDYIVRTEAVGKELLLTVKEGLQDKNFDAGDEDVSVIRFLEPGRPGHNLYTTPRKTL